MKGPCIVDECASKRWSRGMCKRCYQRHRRAGTLPPSQAPALSAKGGSSRSQRIERGTHLPVQPLLDLIDQLIVTRQSHLLWLRNGRLGGDRTPHSGRAALIRGHIASHWPDEDEKNVWRMIERWYANEGAVTNVYTIDRVCVALGYHPLEVYGDEWLRAAERYASYEPCILAPAEDQGTLREDSAAHAHPARGPFERTA